jgi:cell division protein ZapA (FtsZ GTPase activity inhibitor)
LTAGKKAGDIEFIVSASQFIANVREEFFMTSPEEKTRITVDIYGNSYKLMASSSPAYMKSVADLVNDQMFLIAKTFPRLDSQRIAVLASVNMADENLRLKERIEELSKDQKDSSYAQEKYDILQEGYGKLQMLYDNLEEKYDKLLQDQVELKREHETNLKLVGEHAEKAESAGQDKVKISGQNSLLSKQISGLEQSLAEKESLAAKQKADRDAEHLQYLADKEAIRQQYLNDKEALHKQYLNEKEELIERHRMEKEELLRQGSNPDEILQQELAKVESEYRALQEEYGKLQNEYNEWIELVETESPEK